MAFEAMPPMIELDQLTKRFGAITAVDNVTMSVNTGEVLGFLGPNGAGKSTTMKMVAGFLDPTSGQVCLRRRTGAGPPMEA